MNALYSHQNANNHRPHISVCVCTCIAMYVHTHTHSLYTQAEMCTCTYMCRHETDTIHMFALPNMLSHMHKASCCSRVAEAKDGMSGIQI